VSTQDKCCTIVPYFKVHDGKLDTFKDISRKLVERSSQEPKCLFYSFTFSGDEAHCREGYEDAQGVLDHLSNSGALIEQLLAVSDLTRHEIHGPAEEIDKLREPLAGVAVQFFFLEHGFRR
jgi:quinol monooxygenase YgiN